MRMTRAMMIAAMIRILKKVADGSAVSGAKRKLDARRFQRQHFGDAKAFLRSRRVGRIAAGAVSSSRTSDVSGHR